MARLKVFAAQLGFFETVVAVPSKKAALEAWGAHQDLFGQGAAAAAEDPKAVEAALAQPGVVLRRPLGSRGAFVEDAGLEALKLPPAKAKKAAKAKAAKPQKARPPPDRSALNAAQKALAERESAFAVAQGEINARRRALDDEAEALRAAYRKDRKRLEAARAEAEAAFRNSGGR